MVQETTEKKTAYTREDLYFKEYKWVATYEESDSRISGQLDEVFFCRKNGEEVLYMINACADKWNWDKTDIHSMQKLEKLIYFFLPKLISTQKNVVLWIELNWRKYWNML